MPYFDLLSDYMLFPCTTIESQITQLSKFSASCHFGSIFGTYTSRIEACGILGEAEYYCRQLIVSTSALGGLKYLFHMFKKYGVNFRILNF